MDKYKFYQEDSICRQMHSWKDNAWRNDPPTGINAVYVTIYMHASVYMQYIIQHNIFFFPTFILKRLQLKVQSILPQVKRMTTQYTLYMNVVVCQKTKN